jgi:hypothetical protein
MVLRLAPGFGPEITFSNSTASPFVTGRSNRSWAVSFRANHSLYE